MTGKHGVNHLYSPFQLSFSDGAQFSVGRHRIPVIGGKGSKKGRQALIVGSGIYLYFGQGMIFPPPPRDIFPCSALIFFHFALLLFYFSFFLVSPFFIELLHLSSSFLFIFHILQNDIEISPVFF
jgi:hypothetical protein